MHPLLPAGSLLRRYVLVACLGLLPLPDFAHAVEPVRLTAPRDLVIKGTVTDGKEPLPGVNVSLKGTRIGVTTDSKGSFTLSVPSPEATLVFSYIGFVRQEVVVGTQTNLAVTLQPDAKGLEEVVVVGYGTQKKANLTGAVSQVGSEIIDSRPVANVTQALQGAVPNVNVTFGDGRPGSAGTINIRGFASINSTTGSPLILIDGVPGSLNSINPRDVENISVLKDAASSAIYGARGAFGVVLVTTKRASTGKMQVNYSTNFGWSTPTVRTDFITDGYTSAKLNDEAFLRAVGKTYTGYTDQDYEELKKRQTDKSLPSVVIDNRNGKDMYIYYGNTDWWSTMFRKWSPSMEHNLSFNGGNDKTNYLISGRYYQKRGVMRLNQDEYNGYNFRAKLNTKVTDWFTLNTNTQFNSSDYTYPGWGVNSNFVSVTVHALPSYVPVNPDGTATYRTELNNYTIGDGIYADLLHGKSKGGEKRFELTNTVGGTLKLSKDLSVVGSYSYTLSNGTFNVNRSAWEGGNTFLRRTPAPWSIYPGVISSVGYDQLNETSNLSQYHVVNAYATYDKSFGDHGLKAMIGYNQELYQQKSLSGNRKDLLSEDLNDVNLGSGAQEINGGQAEWALLGYFARINYDYRGKYLLELNGRYDGTSRFQPSDRFGFFPSVSAGWRVSQENFFEPVKNVVNDLKFRASYGALGNQQVANYAYISSLARGTLSYLMNGVKTEYLSSPSPISNTLTWEKATSADLGVDVVLLRNKLNFTFDWYRRATTQMLTKGRTLPTVFGATEPRENAADLLTKGFEISLGWRDQVRVGAKPLQYNVGVVLSDYTAKITRFDNPTQLLSSYYVGQQLGEMWGYSVDGMFGSDDEAAAWQAKIPLANSAVHRQISSAPGEWGKLRAGDLRFVDVNGDNKIGIGANTVGDHGDLKRIGNSLPRYSFGFNGSVSWNGIDVSAFFQGIGRQNWYPGANADKFWGPYSRPYYSFVPKDFESQIWTETNRNAYLPVLRGYTALNGGGDLQAANDRYIQNLAYVRLKNLTVGYTLPNQLLQRLKMSRCRIYASGENLFTLTRFKTKYIDPEMAAAETNGRVYPFSKVFSMGLDISF